LFVNFKPVSLISTCNTRMLRVKERIEGSNLDAEKAKEIELERSQNLLEKQVIRLRLYQIRKNQIHNIK
jgi:hypothetical protein